jgi:hypothetical protein
LRALPWWVNQPNRLKLFLSHTDHASYRGVNWIGALCVTLQLVDICTVDHRIVTGGEALSFAERARDKPGGQLQVKSGQPRWSHYGSGNRRLRRGAS